MNLFLKLLLVIRTIENFQTAILDRIGFIHGKVIYKTRDNMRFIARAGTEDIAEIAVVASGSEYNLKILNLPQKPTIVDLGGHIGTFSVMIAKKFEDTSRVIVYEPDKANYNLLVENINLNKLHSISPQNVAISDYSGKGHLRVEEMNTDAYYLDAKSSKKPNVAVDTLYGSAKKLGFKKIDLLKMDIEGGEYKIFSDKKTFDFITKNVHYIFIEYHNIDTVYNSKFIRKVIKKKFKIIHSHKSVFTLRNIQWK